jgi:MoxR-like ATPase
MTIDIDPNSPESAIRRDAIRAGRAGSARLYVPYQYSADAAMAVKVALATSRPLLLRGEAGCGKSTLAFDAAVCLGWSYYEMVFTSRTTASEAMWSVDAVRRLADAPVVPERARDLRNYVNPGALWWAFDPSSAAEFMRDDPGEAADPASAGSGSSAGAVVLLDEIDKADPDVPNDLLQPLGDNRFTVPELRYIVTRRRPLLFIVTSNQERALTRAFLRRCVCYTFPKPTAAWLHSIAVRHFPDVERGLVNLLIEVLMTHRDQTPDGAHRPGVSELLDAIRACHALGIHYDRDGDWDRLAAVLMRKHEGDQ